MYVRDRIIEFLQYVYNSKPEREIDKMIKMCYYCELMLDLPSKLINGKTSMHYARKRNCTVHCKSVLNKNNNKYCKVKIEYNKKFIIRK